MHWNALTPSTPSNPVPDGVARPDRTPSRNPVPPYGGGLRDGVQAAGPEEGSPRPVLNAELGYFGVVEPWPCRGCANCLPAAHCAFDACQAGGDILAGAPRVERSTRPDWPSTASYGEPRTYHLGCWDAEQRRGRSQP